MKVKLELLGNAALDWAVAKYLGWEVTTPVSWSCKCKASRPFYKNPRGMVRALPYYSSDWFQAGQLIEKYKMNVRMDSDGQAPYWVAVAQIGLSIYVGLGDNPCIAVARCFVFIHDMSERIEVPEEVL
jgi:Protein of unknown function (DUF2591)